MRQRNKVLWSKLIYRKSWRAGIYVNNKVETIGLLYDANPPQAGEPYSRWALQIGLIWINIWIIRHDNKTR